MSIGFIVPVVVLVLYMLNQAINYGNSKHKFVLTLLSRTFILIGGGALVFTLIYFSMQSKPKDIEWPIEHTNQAIALEQGYTVVPHDYFPRVQVYDQSLEYIRGWRIPSSGGFEIIPNGINTFYVVTYRGKRKYLYKVSGELISTEKYSGEYLQDNPHKKEISFAVPVYLVLFKHPFNMLVLLGFGVFILISLRQCKPNKRLQ